MAAFFRLSGLAFLLVAFSTIADANATLKASLKGSLDGVENTEIYSLQGATARTKVDSVLTEIGKRIRQKYYVGGYEVRGYGGTKVDINVAYQDMSTKKGEFQGISKSDLAAFDKWVEKNNVTTIQAVTLEANYRGGTGLEDLYIFVPKMPAKEVLVYRAFWYAE